MKRYGNLWSKIVDFENLWWAARNGDHFTIIGGPGGEVRNGDGYHVWTGRRAEFHLELARTLGKVGDGDGVPRGPAAIGSKHRSESETRASGIVFL